MRLIWRLLRAATVLCGPGEPEIAAVQLIHVALGPLDQQAQARVLIYALYRYAVVNKGTDKDGKKEDMAHLYVVGTPNEGAPN